MVCGDGVWWWRGIAGGGWEVKVKVRLLVMTVMVRAWRDVSDGV